MEEEISEKQRGIEGSMNINLQKHPEILNETIRNATVIYLNTLWIYVLLQK